MLHFEAWEKDTQTSLQYKRRSGDAGEGKLSRKDVRECQQQGLGKATFTQVGESLPKASGPELPC